MQLLVRNFSVQSPYRKQQAFGSTKLPFKPFKVVDEAAYETFAKQKITNGFSIMAYAAKWASLMEDKLNRKGNMTFADVAKYTSIKANSGRITNGFQNEAVEILSKHWVHGEELRKVYPA